MNHAQFPPPHYHYHCSCSCLFDKFDFFDLCRDNSITTTFSSFHTGFCTLVWSLSIKILLFLYSKDEAISSKSHIQQFSYVITGKELKYFFRCVGAKNFSLHIFEDSVFTKHSGLLKRGNYWTVSTRVAMYSILCSLFVNAIVKKAVGYLPRKIPSLNGELLWMSS